MTSAVHGLLQSAPGFEPCRAAYALQCEDTAVWPPESRRAVGSEHFVRKPPGCNDAALYLVTVASVCGLGNSVHVGRTLQLSLLEPLIAASVSESTPVLLELARQQAKRRRPADLLTQFARDGYVAPAVLDLRTAHRLDGLALEAAPDFEALQLSPVAPLGCCSVLAPTSQDRTLSAMRGTEVVSDPTNVMALASAGRLKTNPDSPVKLCTIHQTLRAQSIQLKPGHSRHFKLFALTQVGTAEPNDGFEVEALVRHLAVFDTLLDSMERELGYTCPRRRVVLRATPQREVLVQRLTERIARTLPHVELEREPLESSYYDGVRVMFGPHTPSGGVFTPIADSGCFDWLEKLTSNRRFRFVASGFGLQLAPFLFAT